MESKRTKVVVSEERQESKESETSKTQKNEKEDTFSLVDCYITKEPSFLELSDFIIVGVDGVEHKVHRVILSSYSLHFRETIFAHPQSKEYTEGKYSFSKEIDPSHLLKNVINYMYGIELNLSPETSAAYYKIADFLQMPKLIKYLQDYFYRTNLELFSPDNLLSLCDQEFLITWLSNDQLLVNNEEKVYEVIGEMVNQITQESDLPQKLMECIRFFKLSNEYLKKANENPRVPRQLLLDHTLHLRCEDKTHNAFGALWKEGYGESSTEKRFTARKTYQFPPVDIMGVTLNTYNARLNRRIDVKVNLNNRHVTSAQMRSQTNFDVDFKERINWDTASRLCVEFIPHYMNISSERK